jgi:hypothetical protein
MVGDAGVDFADAERTARGDLRNFHIFDFAINGLV